MSIEAMKAIQMVYANTTKHDWPDDIWGAICQAIKAEKHEVSQKPVAWIEHHKGGDNLVWDDPSGNRSPLYTHPQPKQDNTDLDAICQDLQEKTYTQAMRIAELEAKLLDKQQFTNVVNPSIHAGSSEKIGENHHFHHSGIEQKPLASDGSDGSAYKKAIEDVGKAFEHRSLAEAEKQEPVAWIDDEGEFQWIKKIDNPEHTALYTHPQPKREWVGLTDEEMRELEKQFEAERVRTSDEEYLVIYPADYWRWQRAIEAKLKEKNT